MSVKFDILFYSPSQESQYFLGAGSFRSFSLLLDSDDGVE